MADQDYTLMASILYWGKEKCYHKMQEIIEEARKSYLNDPVLVFMNAVSLYLEGKVQESLRQLESVMSKQDVGLATTVLMINIHKKEKHAEKEALQMLDGKMKTEQKQAGPKSMYYVAWLHFMMENFERAKDYIGRAINMSSTSKEIFNLKAWIDLLGGDSFESKRSFEYFDKCIRSEGPKHPSALLGKVKFLEMYMHQEEDVKKADDEILELLNQSVVMNRKFTPGLVEKMRFFLLKRDWEQALDTCHRILELDEHCLQAKQLMAVYYLIKEVNYEEASKHIGSLSTSMNLTEPQNAHLFTHNAKLFSRLCARNADVLRQCIAMSERALRNCEELMLTTKHLHLAEMGEEMLMQGKIKEANKCFEAAYEMGEEKLFPLTGKLKCHLLLGELQEFSNQLEFLEELKETIGTSPELEYLKGLGLLKRNEPYEKVFPLIKKAVEMHFSNLDQTTYDMNFLVNLNPDFLVDVVNSLMTFAPQQPLGKGQTVDTVLCQCMMILECLKKDFDLKLTNKIIYYPLGKGQTVDTVLCQCMMILECLKKNAPAHVEVSYLMARNKFLLGDTASATKLLHQCLQHDPTSSKCHILMAQVCLHDNNFKMADQSLDAGLSYNFKVREHPLYHLIKSQILKKQGQVSEALKALQVAINLPGVKPNKGQINKKDEVAISTSDQMSVYLELADTYRLLNQTAEASKIMESAMRDFQGTGEEVRMIVSNVDLCLARGEVEEALTMLRDINHQQAYYIQAKQKMADIYLKNKKDKKLYISCYLDLYKKVPGSQTGILLGDAYMEVQEPEQAIQAYETAIKKNPRDAALASKIGQALVRTHQYGRAIVYYEASLKQSEQQFLRYDLAKLLMLLKHDEKAEKILKSFLDKEEKSIELETMIEIARCSYLMSLLCHKRGTFDEKIIHLTRAKEIQERVIMRVAGDQSKSLEEQKRFAATICAEFGKHYVLVRNYMSAIQSYKEVLRFNENDSKSALELANLLMLVDEFNECQKICLNLIENDKEKELAAVMLAEVMFKMNAQDNALEQIETILKLKPDNYLALSRVIEIMRRAGELDTCSKFLELARLSTKNEELDPGFNFCMGLYHWYTGKVNDALKKLNRARKDSEYGSKATYLMIEICLNPDNDTLGGEVFEGLTGSTEAGEKREIEKVGLETAEKLLKDMRPGSDDLKHYLMTNIHLIVTRNRNLVEPALNNLLELCKADQDNVMALYGTAVAFMILKQTPKARSQLKRVARIAWNLEDAEYLERSWLLLADIYIQRENYDLAKEMLGRCLMYNKSSCKAYEYLGYIYEKHNSHAEASTVYQSAWKFGQQKNPAIGYKLAFNLLKTKKFTDAIDVCHQVLTARPTYPKIQKEILNKARTMLKAS